MRYVLVAFFFLGLVFYEMSGGADFDGEATRMARIEVPLAADPEKLETIFAEPGARLPENVSRIALNLDSVQDVVRPARRTPSELAPVSTSQDQPRPSLSEEPPAEFVASLIGAPAGTRDALIDSSAITSVNFGDTRPVPLRTRVTADTEVAAPQTTEIDIRSVSGSAVNVRGGPGTSFSVVNRLVLGDEVEVLQESGDGWVQLRPLNGSAIGWTASFLLDEG